MMRVALACLATDNMMSFAHLAREAERRGFDALFTGEHAHIPVGAKQAGAPLPEFYSHVLDPFQALASAAMVTDRIRLGTSVCLVALHDPIRLAKSVSTLDHLSAGRVVFGIGHGYLEREIANHGVDPHYRRGILRDKMLAVESIWANDVASYAGKYVAFEECVQYPKPVQRPRPPVLLGAKMGERTLDYIVEFCDGWLPTARMAGDGLGHDIVTLRQRAADAGRDPESIDVTVTHATRAAGHRADDGNVDLVTAEQIEKYEAIGVNTVILTLPSADEAELMRVLDRYAGILGDRLQQAAT